VGGKRFICPHCCRAGGKIGGAVQGELVCGLCIADGLRVREVVFLIYKALPTARKSGKPIPELIVGLFVGWCMLRRLNDLAAEGQALIDKWRKQDAVDQS